MKVLNTLELITRGEIQRALKTDSDRNKLNFFLQHLAVGEDFLLELRFRCGCLRYIKCVVAEPKLIRGRYADVLREVRQFNLIEVAMLRPEYDVLLTCGATSIPPNWFGLPIFGIMIDLEHSEGDSVLHDRWNPSDMRPTSN